MNVGFPIVVGGRDRTKSLGTNATPAPNVPDSGIAWIKKPGTFAVTEGFSAINGTQSCRWVGNADDPGTNPFPGSIVTLYGVPGSAQNAELGYTQGSGGSQYPNRDPGLIQYAAFSCVVTLSDGSLAAIVHCERWYRVAGSGQSSTVTSLPFYTCFATARSTDGGATWQFGAEFLSPRPAFPVELNNSQGVPWGQQDLAGGPMVPVGRYYYLYFTEFTDATSSTQYIAVARCPIADFDAACLAGTRPPFVKRTASGWGTVTGAYGRTAPCDLGAPLPTPVASPYAGAGRLNGIWPDVWHDPEAGLYLMVLCNETITGGGLQNLVAFLVTSRDGINWSAYTQVGQLSEIPGFDEGAGRVPASTPGEGQIYSTLRPSKIVGNRSGVGPWHVWSTNGQRFSNCTYIRHTATFRTPALTLPRRTG